MSLYNRQLPQTLVTGCVGTDCSLEWLINLEEENGQDNYRTIVHFQALMYVEAIHPSICPLILSRVVGGALEPIPELNISSNKIEDIFSAYSSDLGVLVVYMSFLRATFETRTI